MNVCIAQLNYTVGDLVGNTDKIINVMRQEGERVDLIIFSELCITGYYPKDLIEREGFIDAQLDQVNRIREASASIRAGVIIGLVKRNMFGGKRYHNALELIDNGQCVFQYTKQLLPTYGVFDEARHFEPGNQPGLYNWRGKRLGFLICEDAWEDDASPLYKKDPVAELQRSQLDLVISINASPYTVGKRVNRLAVVSKCAKRCKCPVIYTNQVGGIDELVYDGGSVVYTQTGECAYEGATFEEEIGHIDTANLSEVEPRAIAEIKSISDQLVTGLRDYCRKTGFSSVVIGSSGGIDSAVVIAIAVLALGSENVTAVTMPSKFSSKGSVDDSRALCEALNVHLITSPIMNTFCEELKIYELTFGRPPSALAQENLQARIRGQRLMTFSNSTGAMVISTGNKTELAVGYCTLYGDMAGGLSVLGDLYKGQVYQLAAFLNEEVFKDEVVPQSIITKAPSAELSEGQMDTDSLPPYDQLDAYLKLLLEADLLTQTERTSLEETAQMMPEDMQVRVRSLLDRNEYKRRQGAPVIRVNRRAFGSDRQIPLTMRLRAE